MDEPGVTVMDLFNVGEDGPAKDVDAEYGTPAYVFLIDCSNSMLKPVCYLLTCLKAIKMKLRDMIFNRSRFFASVILMATDKMNNDANVKNVYILIPLLPCGVDVIKKLEDAIEMASTDSFENEYGSGDFCLSDALWVATTLLQEAKRKLKKGIFLLTNHSSAFSSQENVRIFSIVSDFERSKIQFTLVPMGTSFDSKPYKEFLELAKSPENTGPVIEEAEVADRFTFSGKTVSRTVALVKLKFHITDDVSVAVSINSLGSLCLGMLGRADEAAVMAGGGCDQTQEVFLGKFAWNLPVQPSTKRRTVPNAVTLHSATNEAVEKKTVQKLLDDENDEEDVSQPAAPSADPDSASESSGPWHPASIVHCEDVGGKTIAFTREEMDQINSLKEPELRLIGFKSMESCLSYQLHLQSCSLIYPVESTAQGSTALFTALLRRCQAKGVVAFCTYYPRRTATVRYVVLVPSTSPEGFILIYLPFGSEVRDAELEAATATTEQVDLMKKLVKRMRFAYKPENFPNPRIACHWRAVEALALDKFEPEPVSDSSLPDYDALAVRLEEVKDEIFQKIYGGAYHDVGRATAKKSATPADVMDDIAAVENHFKEDSMKKLTNAQLRSYLKSVGLPASSTMKKADLLDAAANHLKKHGV